MYYSFDALSFSDTGPGGDFISYNSIDPIVRN